MLNIYNHNEREKGGANNGLSFEALEKAVFAHSFINFFKKPKCGRCQIRKLTIPSYFRDMYGDVTLYSWCKECHEENKDLIKLSDQEIFTIKIIHGL